MAVTRAALEQEHARLARWLAANGAAPLRAEVTDAVLQLVPRLLGVDLLVPAVTLAEALATAAPNDAQAWLLLGRALAAAQRLGEALPAFERAASLAPEDPDIALAHARATFDVGLPAVSRYTHAMKTSAGSLAAVAGLAASLVEAGRISDAERLLADTLATRPDWLAGHKALVDLRWSFGDRAPFDRSYETACAALPASLPLRLAWFGALSQAGAWDRARQVASEGQALLGNRPALTSALALVASEAGEVALADQLFAQIEVFARQDAGTGLAYLRHSLKASRPDVAQTIADAFLAGPAATLFWPYQSILWRLRGDARAAWLEGDSLFIRTFDLQLSAAQLERLAGVLRRGHAANHRLLEQSVRGGTQTHAGRQLFAQTDPEIQDVRARAGAAIAAYVAALPPRDPGHPLLAWPRTPIQFSGSWSVRLTGSGHHVSHTHPRGWISSALHVSLPPPAMGDGAQAGWLQFGSPPAGLGVDLPPYAQIKPTPGHLVLFPSTLWHQTLPFSQGERLTIAFDVRRPAVSG